MSRETTGVFRTLHSWVGIVSALFLLIAFYGGALTMFKEPLSTWGALPCSLPAAPSLADTPALLEAVDKAHPEARKSKTVHYTLDPAHPARITWTLRTGGTDDHHAKPRVFGASLDASGALVVEELRGAPVADFLDDLHRKAGLPLPEDWAMPAVGLLCLLYFLALVSGIVILLPGLASGLFQLRLSARSLRRRWLDLHNLLGLFSLPFHLVIAFTALVFALHDEFYAVENLLLRLTRPTAGAGAGSPAPREAKASPAASTTEPRITPRPLSPLELKNSLATQAPDFKVLRADYNNGPAGPSLRVFGSVEGQIQRGPSYGILLVDTITGRLANTDYYPGRQGLGLATVSSFFALHFGNYGGTPVRWAYVLLGFSGAFLFFTGNMLWLDVRRRRESDGGGISIPSLASRVLEALSYGVGLGCVCACSAVLALAPWLPAASDQAFLLGLAWYLVVGACVVISWIQGGPRALPGLLALGSLASLLIPLGSLSRRLCAGPTDLGQPTPYTSGGFGPVEATALLGALLLAFLARRYHKRPQQADHAARA